MQLTLGQVTWHSSYTCTVGTVYITGTERATTVAYC